MFSFRPQWPKSELSNFHYPESKIRGTFKWSCARTFFSSLLDSLKVLDSCGSRCGKEEVSPGVRHPLCPVIRLGLRNPRKKERKSASHPSYNCKNVRAWKVWLVKSNSAFCRPLAPSRILPVLMIFSSRGALQYTPFPRKGRSKLITRYFVTQVLCFVFQPGTSFDLVYLLTNKVRSYEMRVWAVARLE